MRTRTRRTTSTSQNKDEDEVMDSVCPHPPQILGEMGPDETGSDESARGDSVGAGSVGDESQTRAPKKSKQAARAENPNSKSVASSARAAGRSRAASGKSGKSRVASRALAACGAPESEESRPGSGPGIPTVDMEGGEAAPATPVPVPAQRIAPLARSIRFDAGAAARSRGSRARTRAACCRRQAFTNSATRHRQSADGIHAPI